MISILVLLFFAQAQPLPQQQHGVMLTWQAPTNGNAPGGYKVYRCWGSCTQSSTQWILISGATMLPASALTFLDSATGPQAPNLKTPYSYVVASMDSYGALGNYSNVVNITTPTAWPSNGLQGPGLANPAIQ